MYFYASMSQKNFLTAKRIFTGQAWLEDHAIISVDNRIADIVPRVELDSSIQVKDFGNSFLAPAFIDLQIYGGGGRLFAVFPDTESLNVLVSYCREGGASQCMPTVATNEYEVFRKSIDAINKYWNEGGSGVLGLHIEGPWINVTRRGAHIEKLVHAPSMHQVRELLDYGGGVIKMITLAPEVCNEEVVQYIQSRGIIVSAGHSNASYQQAIKSFDSGITVVTHLYNAMSGLHHREPGLVGACFDHPKVMASIIPDGFHVDFAAIRIAKQIMGDRLFAITDAVTDTTSGYYPHSREGDKYESGGILSGSALNMSMAYFNLVKKVGMEKEEALRMCSLYPSRVIHRDNASGLIKKGYLAEVVAIDEERGIATLPY